MQVANGKFDKWLDCGEIPVPCFDRFRGNGASVLRIVPYAGLQFMGYEQYRRWMIECYPPAASGPSVDLLAGSLAGGTAVLLTYPLDLARTRLAYQVSQYTLYALH